MILLDTNVLVRYVDPSSIDHPTAILAIQHWENQGDTLVFFAQTAYEFWATATRSLGANGLGWTPARCQTQLLKFRKLFQFLPDQPSLYDEWESLVTQHACHGRISFDARLVAAMRTHNLTRILTFNGSDFTRFPGIIVLDPNAVVVPPTPPVP